MNLPGKPEGWTWKEGIGHLPPKRSFPYDSSYFRKYEDLAQTPQGETLLGLRLQLLERWIFNRSEVVLLDVGIGCGAFVQALHERGWKALGTDINPVAVEWLKEHGSAWDHRSLPSIVTFWDTLEHLPDPSGWITSWSPGWVFCSLPIFKDETHCLASKHFKPDEHIWYFTEDGLITFFERLGYACMEGNDLETSKGGREDIQSFVFRRM